MSTTETPQDTSTDTAVSTEERSEALNKLEISKLPSSYPEVDESRIADLGKAAEAFKRFVTVLGAFVKAHRARSEAVKAAAHASLDMRRQCIRGDNGHPDWAGQVTFAYRVVFKDRAKAAYKAAGMSEEEITSFEAAVRGYIRDTNLTQTYIAQYRLDTDSALSKVKALPAPGEEMPEALLAAVKDEYASQVTSTGKSYRGFEQDSVRPALGRPPKTTGGGSGSGGGSGQMTPSKAWQKIREELPNLTPADTGDEIYHLVTAFSQRLTGKPDEKAPTGIKERKKVIEALRSLAEVASKTADFLDADTPLKDRAVIAEHYWQG